MQNDLVLFKVCKFSSLISNIGMDMMGSVSIRLSYSPAVITILSVFVSGTVK